MGELLLGLDIGTSSTKAVLARPDGSVAASGRRDHRVSMPRPGWAEHDVERVWWDEVRALCAELLAFEPRGALAGICVSGIGPCLAPCDSMLRPLRPAILYGIDTRADGEIEELNSRYGEEAILRRGGSPLTSQAVGPKLLWLQRREPEVWSRTAGWYMASSFVVARLTGEYILDHHSASQSDPLYDLEARAWIADWAAELAGDVPLPRLVWPSEVVGTVSRTGADASGIPEGVPVVAGTVDAWAEAYSVGVRRPGDVMLMYGSTTFIIGVYTRPPVHPKLWATAGVEPGTRCLAAGMATSGLLLEWMREIAGDVPIETLVAEASAVPPGAGGLLLLPYFAGERSPLFDADARGMIAGLTLRHRRGHLARAAYEAIALGTRHNLETMASVAGAPARVVAVGGGTQGGFWPQVVSDVANVEQLVPTETVGASYGDALLAGIGTGLVPADTDWTKVHHSVAPRPGDSATYDELYDLYRELYTATADVAHRLAKLQRGSRP